MGGPSINRELAPARKKTAQQLTAIARVALWLIAVGILVIIPWSFGGNGPEGYYWIVWSGRLCAVPLALWGAACALRRERPGVEFWGPVICWSLLAVQVFASLSNPSHMTEAPWVGDGFVRIAHRENLPSSAFTGATVTEGNLWLAFALLALTARCVGLTRRQLRLLLWLFVVNATVLALLGIPFKFSGEKLVLGRWPVQEAYFYSTFLYHNHWSAFALLAAAAAAALCSSTGKTAARIVLVGVGVVLAASAPLSASRLGSIAMLAFGAVIVVTLLRKKIRVTPGLLGGIALGVAVIAGGSAFFYKARAVNRGDRTWSAILRSNPFGLRQTFVEDTLPMLKEKPLFGWGLGGFGAAFRFYQREETRIVHNQGRITLYDHIHNDWLERLAELGVIGFSLFIAPGILWLGSVFRHKPVPEIHFWLLVGSVGVLIFALGDMAFVNRVVAATFALFVGIATSTGNCGRGA